MTDINPAVTAQRWTDMSTEASDLWPFRTAAPSCVWLGYGYVIQAWGMPNGWTRVGIRRADGGVEFPWTERQRIKSELFGTEREAIEIHPPESEVVDCAPMAWLFVLPAGERLPVSLSSERQAVNEGRDPNIPPPPRFFARRPR